MTPEQLENKIEGILNDFEQGVSDKDETFTAILELIIKISQLKKK